MALLDVDSLCDIDALTRLMQANDPVALEAIARCYGQRLVLVARSSCRVADDAEDAVQDALVEAGRCLESYRGEGSPLAWLSTLVVRRCHRIDRRKSNDPSLHLRDHETRCTCATPETRTFHGELGVRLGQAIAALSPTDRAVVVLAHDGLTGPAIAARLDLTPNAVRSRLKRARQQLRADLADLIEPWSHP